MKRVKGWMSVRPIGCWDFDFFVDDDMSKEEIEEMIMDEAEYSFHYDIESGYEEYTEVKYRKNGENYEN